MSNGSLFFLGIHSFEAPKNHMGFKCLLGIMHDLRVIGNFSAGFFTINATFQTMPRTIPGK